MASKKKEKISYEILLFKTTENKYLTYKKKKRTKKKYKERISQKKS